MSKMCVLLFFLLYCSHITTTAQGTFSQNSQNRIFQSSVEMLAHKQYGASYIGFDDIVENYSVPDNIHSINSEYYRAHCSINLFHEDGVKLMEDFIDTTPDDIKAISGNFDLANYYYQRKKYSVSTNYFEKVDFEVLSREQKNMGHFRWGYSLLNQNQLNDALVHFNATKVENEHYSAGASYYAGYIEILNGDFDNALFDLKRAERSPSYSSVVTVLIAQIYYSQKEYDKLIKYSEPVLAQGEVMNSEIISVLLAEAYSHKENNVKALGFYKKFLDKKKGNADTRVLYRAGRVAYLCNNTDLALKYLKMVAQKPDSLAPYASYYLGVIYIQNNHKSLALTALSSPKKFLKNKTLASESLFLSAKINHDLGYSDEAISELELLTNNYPNYVNINEAKQMLLQAYFNSNSYNKAIEYFESLAVKSVQIQQVYQKATLLKGIELFNKENYNEAISFFNKSIKSPIDKKILVEARLWGAESYSILKNYDMALMLYRSALKNATLKPELMKNINYGLGYVLFNQKQYNKSLIHFNNFVKQSSSSEANYWDGLIRLADCYYVSKDFVKALDLYKNTILSSSTDTDYAHLQCGLILAIQRKYAEAAGEFEQVVNLSSSPYHDEAIVQRAQLEFEQSNYENAVNWYTKMVNNSPNSKFIPLALSRRAAANYNLQNYDYTANDYITILTKFTTHPIVNEILLPLQEALGLCNRSDELGQYLKIFSQANPESKALESVEFEVAQNVYFSQKYEQSIELFNQYLVSYPNSAFTVKVKYYRAEAYYRLKDFPSALEKYYQLAEKNPSVLIPRILGRIGEIEFLSENYSAAISAYKNLNGIAESKKGKNRAWMGLLQSYYFLNSHDSVNYYAEKILEQGNVSIDATTKATLFLGKSAMAKRDYELAKDEFIATVNEARDESGAEAKYWIGKIFYLNEEYPQCYNTMLELIQEFPTYKLWVGRAYLLIADNFYATGDVFQTKGTLKSLIDNFPLKSIQGQAKNKLKEIEESELTNKITPKTDTINDQ